ncbi:MAG: NUDIX domain-containing protein [Ferruginibacter sp.]|nr:NUDIX domain-containing protein [Ferruginibacter sp.]
MQIKIYVDESPIYITDELSDELKKLSNQKEVLFFNEKLPTDAAEILSALQDNKKEAAIIYGKNLQELKEDFFQQFIIIEAAGGIVQNENKDLLFIFRRNKWDLPKGKMEEGETPEICAEREIEEETGVKNLLLKHTIGETYHIYTERGKTILKISHWFYFTTEGEQKTIPQTEEDIAEVKWIHTRNIKEPMANTHQNIKDILTIFFDTP